MKRRCWPRCESLPRFTGWRPSLTPNRPRRRLRLDGFGSLEFLLDAGDVVDGFAVRRNPVVFVHSLRARIIGRQGVAQPVVVLFQKIAQVARPRLEEHTSELQ